MSLSVSHFASEFEEHLAVAAKTRDTLGPALEAMHQAWLKTVKSGGKILFFGNGGSAADAQHLATELSVRYIRDRAPIPGLALTTDTSSLTAIGNDMGFEQLFARQVEALGRPGDLALGFSTSGNSPNVIAALKMAKDKGLTAGGFTGRGGGAMIGVADPLLVVPSDSTARIQEMHITLGHLLCGALEKELGLVS